MANTTNFGWETPDDTDLVKDGAAAMRTLGNAIDTSLVDLKGGTTGQVLSKNTNSDMDFVWTTPNVGDITEVQAGTGISVASGTGPIPVVTNTVATTFDAKGDLVVGTGADTFAKLTVGTNDYVLTADSTTSTGLKWAAAAGGSTFSGASVYKNNTAQSVANATTVAATFDTEAFDTDGYHSTTTNTSRFTIPSGKDGKYLVLGRVTYVANSSGVRQGRLLKNGNLIGLNTDTTPGSGGGQNIEVSGIYSAVAGDYFEVAYWQNSGGSLNSESGGEFYDAFFIQYLGA